LATQTRTSDLILARRADGLEVDLLPLQGLWTEEQYLKLTDQTYRLIEFTVGDLEVLPVPTTRHQVLMLFLYELFRNAVKPTGGIVLVAGLRVRIRAGKYREPDVLLMMDARDPRNQDRYWLGADLVVEVVSPGNPERDIDDKPLDYAKAGIPEYCIVNPLDETISVLTLAGNVYMVHRVFRRCEDATSLLLDGFGVSMDAVVDAQ
jgi:Uma2 family endonuclease